jgi:hypothetical protein
MHVFFIQKETSWGTILKYILSLNGEEYSLISISSWTISGYGRISFSSLPSYFEVKVNI